MLPKPMQPMPFLTNNKDVAIKAEEIKHSNKAVDVEMINKEGVDVEPIIKAEATIKAEAIKVPTRTRPRQKGPTFFIQSPPLVQTTTPTMRHSSL